jgi:hypothetical protein
MDRLTHLAFSFDFQEKDLQDFYEQNPIIIRELIYRFNDDNPGSAEGSTQSIRRAVKACTDRGACELCRVHGKSDFQHGHRCQTKNRRSSRWEFLLPGSKMSKGESTAVNVYLCKIGMATWGNHFIDPDQTYGESTISLSDCKMQKQTFLWILSLTNAYIDPFFVFQVWNCYFPIYQCGNLHGAPATLETSAAGLGEVTSLTAPKFLAGPLIIKMTVPLLRIVGDKKPRTSKSRFWELSSRATSCQGRTGIACVRSPVPDYWVCVCVSLLLYRLSRPIF